MIFVNHASLQWGRAPRSAETKTEALLWFRDEKLQWGRAPRSAETWSARRSSSVSSASMGPRSDERGNAAKVTDAQVTAQGFNGAALRGARKR